MPQKRNQLVQLTETIKRIPNIIVREVPHYTMSSAKWGVLQTSLSIFFFSIALFFALRPSGGDVMAYVFLAMGIVSFLFWVIMVVIYIKQGHQDQTATKADLYYILNKGGVYPQNYSDVSRINAKIRTRLEKIRIKNENISKKG